MKPHILQVITELEPAGAERVLADLSIELKNRKYGVTVISLQNEPAVKTIVNDLQNNGIEIFYLNVTKKYPWRIFKIKKLIANIKTKHSLSEIIVHSHLMHANLACRFAKLTGQKFNLVNTIHIAEKRPNQKLMFFLDRISLNLCNVYTAVSKSAAKWHESKLECNHDRIKTVHNGIIPPTIPTDGNISKVISEWGFENCKKIIGSVGRLEYQKGYDTFLKILPELSKVIPTGETWGVVILGEGSDRLKLENIAKRVPDNIKIQMPGYRKDAASYIGVFDLFVMPSRYEGFGLSLVEAMFWGIPILANNAESLSEILKICGNRNCIDFSDTKKVVQSIIESINIPLVVNDISSFTVEKMTDNYIKLYESL